MEIDMAKKIKILLAYREMNMAELARAMHISKSALSERMKRNRWTVGDLQQIAEILNSDVHCNFVLRDSGQEI